MSAAADEALLTRAARLADERLAPAAPGWSMGAEPDPALFAEAGRAGLFGVEIPRAEGGLGLSFKVKAALAERLARVDFGFAMSVINTHNVGLRLAASAPEALRRRWLPELLAGRLHACTALTEPGAGSDLAAMRTVATREGAHWRLDGEKSWIVNARRAGLAIVFAQCGAPGDVAGIGAFAVDLAAEGARRRAIDAPFALTSIGAGAIALTGVRVPEDHLLLPPGAAFGAIMNEINGARAYVAAMCCGMLAEALDRAAAHGAARRVFGKPLRAHPAWAAELARAAAALEAARALTARAVEAVAAGRDAQLVAAEAKVVAVETCQRALPELLHAMGAKGLEADQPFSRHLAAAQMAGLADGATWLLRARAARLRLREAPARAAATEQDEG
ncbi:acyl-CoA dehydrogenase family protein [Oceanicella actignis]|uniref:acyl-CoA dehydrogenase family protein n=1 Tax=Oceanicella actignis TaxID=1189325 RepID=UPI0011E6678E|nr:acyl-CoA dehydrogenase family protein [Oceanicella actignis]TYO90918.1 alkylation response protein AidB-like acyl-CoA dehydrogenase [Oceanicella actignis]